MSRVVPRRDASYPAGLCSLADPPAVLHVDGSVPLCLGVAVVGTRRATSYGLEVAESYGRALAAAGWTVVSGLARGVDAAAHRGTVAGGGVGVAVLGSGLDVVYPPENRGLARQLVSGGGAVVSEYGEGTPPQPWHFPARNRLIVGLSAAVVVVESAVRGGALITARIAAEIGRPVFAVPGDIDRETSLGCNLLIRDGAIPVLDGGDLLEALSVVPVPVVSPIDR
ncbi:MAG: DNA-processing protein DprA [Acidimicrobiia bacterium]